MPKVWPNPNVPPVPQPLADLASLQVTVLQLRQGVENLGGQRGEPLDRAVTLHDLVRLGVVTADQVYAALKDKG